MGFWGLGVLLWGTGSVHAEMDKPQAEMRTPMREVPVAPATEADLSPIVPDNGYLPLREVIRRFTGRTGVQIKLSQELRDDQETLKKLYASRDDAWLEEFSRVEYDNQQTGKKEIILLKSRYYDASTIPDPTPPPRSRNRTPRVDRRPSPPQADSQNANQDSEKTVDGLSREKLFKLMRFPFRGPFSNEWFEDEDYRNFLAQLQIDSPKAFEDRRVVMKIRNEARKQFRKMRARR